MRSSCTCPRFIVCILLAALVTVSTVQGAPSTSTKADVVGYLRIPNLARSTGRMAQLVDRFQPGAGAMSGMLVMGGLLKGVVPMGVDQTKPMLVFMLNPKQHQEPLVTFVSLNDVDAFKQANPQLPAGGLLIVGRNAALGAPAAVNALRSYLPQLDSLAGGDIPDDARITVNVQRLKTIYSEEIESFLQTAAQGPFAAPPPAGTGEGEAAIFLLPQVLRGLTHALLDDVAKMELGVAFSPDEVRLSHRTVAAKGSDLQAFFAAQEEAPLTLAKRLPAGDPIILAEWATEPESTEAYFTKFMDRVLAGVDTEPGLLDSTTKAMGDFMKAMDGRGAELMFTRNDKLAIVYVAGVRDEEAYRKAYGVYMDLFTKGAWADLFKPLGITYDPSPVQRREYRGLAVDAQSFGMRMEGQPEAQEMITKLYGEGMSTEMSVTRGLAVVTAGPDAQGLMDEMLDMLLDDGEGLAATEAYRKAASSYPDRAGVAFQEYLLRYFQWITSTVGKTQQGAPPMPDIDWASLAGQDEALAGYVTWEDNAALLELRLPVEPLMSMTKAFQETATQAAAGMAPAPMAPPPSGLPAPVPLP